MKYSLMNARGVTRSEVIGYVRSESVKTTLELSYETHDSFGSSIQQKKVNKDGPAATATLQEKLLFLGATPGPVRLPRLPF